MNQKTFTKPLIKWYLKNRRSLPFRKTVDPYHIWVSEIMAQQTQIKTMIPYYNSWIKKWPTIEDLSKASDHEVKKQWEGLGYYSRASNLLKGAKYIMENFDGQFPSEPEQIKEVPGIGDYTTGAISSIAFNNPIPAIDGNVIRVMARVMEDNRDLLKVQNKRELSALLTSLMKGNNPSDFTQGLMELGALICTPTKPDCTICPLNKICLAYKNETTSIYPIKRTKTKVKTLEYDTFVLIDNDHLLIETKNSDGLMKGLVRLPQLPRNSYNLENLSFEFSRKHVFSHRVWLMDVYFGHNLKWSNPHWIWIHLDDIEKYSWSTAHKNILNDILKKR